VHQYRFKFVAATVEYLQQIMNLVEIIAYVFYVSKTAFSLYVYFSSCVDYGGWWIIRTWTVCTTSLCFSQEFSCK